MNSEAYFIRLLDRLDQQGQLPVAARQCSMPEGNAVVSKLLELGIEPDALSRVMAEVFEVPLYSQTRDGKLDFTSKDGRWGVKNKRFFMSNPFAWDQQPSAVLSPHESRAIRDFGILPIASHTKSAPAREDAVEAEVHLKNWIQQAIQMGASDVHITPLSANYVRIKIRMDGSLQVLTEIPMYYDRPGSSYHNISNLLMRFAGLESGSFRRPIDGRFHTHFLPQQIEIRMHMRPVVVQGIASQAFYLRLFNQQHTEKLKRVGVLNLPMKVATAYTEARRLNQSLVLVAGPTGSGKSTSLYANLREILHESPYRSIQTLEDPVECHIEGIEQTEINQHSGLGFEQGLRAMMRSDVDVILVGEIRDAETAKLAIRASLTGHLVFATIHAKSALAAIERMVDFGVSRKMLTMVLSRVFSQRLVRRLCQTCFGKNAESCPSCAGEGFQGRLLLAEVVHLNTALCEAIARGDSFYQIETITQDPKNLTLWECANDFIRRKLTSYAECVKHLPPPPCLPQAIPSSHQLPHSGENHEAK